MRKMLVWFISFAATLACAVSASAQVFINEVRIDEVQDTPSNTDKQEYYELRGQPFFDLEGLTYVVIGRRPIQMISGIPWGGAGVIVHVNDFPAGATIPAWGRYTVRDPQMVLPLGFAVELVLPLGFEDDATQTHLLVRDFKYEMFDDASPPNVGFSPVGYDLDLDNDGELEVTPWGEVVDSISFLKTSTPNAENRPYALNRVGPATDGIPAHLFRCGNNPNWRCGQRAFAVYTPTTISNAGPTQTIFDKDNDYSMLVNGFGESNGPLRVNVTLSADMDEPTESVEVRVAGVSLGFLNGGYPACATGTRTLTLPMDTYNALFCANGTSMQVEVIANDEVEACGASSCKVTIVFDAAVKDPMDTPSRANPSCGCSCEFPQGSIDVVFIVDTSGSMDDEAAALCAAIPNVVSALGAQGLNVSATVLGITETPGGAFDCLSSSVLAQLGNVVPSAAGGVYGTLAHPESWADASAIVSKNFAWAAGHTRLIVTISDEAPFEGNGLPGSECDAMDAASIDNAIGVAQDYGVLVSTLVGTDAARCVADLSLLLAEGTGGGSTSTQAPASQIAAIIAEFLLEAAAGNGCSTCKGDLNLDGVVNAADQALYQCLRDFACLDPNNDGSPGNPNDDLIVGNFHTCGVSDYCGTTPASCLVSHSTPGCEDGACCQVVCAVDPICCTDGWDSVCVSEAKDFCGTCGEISYLQSCFAANAGPGCSDPACCEDVCSIDPTCCSVAWDSNCVFLARLVCVYCGSPSSINCFLPNALPFCEDAECCAKVCSMDPTCCDPFASWDVSCVAIARALCAKCGAEAVGPCNQASFSPACEDKACCEKICQTDPYCCEIMWDAVCAEAASNQCLACGSPAAGSCCLTHSNPFCKHLTCCESVCAADSFCCSNSWDEVCVALVKILCPTLQCPCDTATNSCFVPGNRGGCNNKLCCTLVCEWDNFCCLVMWDNLCSSYATSQCGSNGACVPGTGNCSVPHSTPGCDSPPSCCSQVCAFMPECCTIAWDILCVDAAFNVCQNCGNPDTGSCYADSGSPGCADPICCQVVCNLDPFCCAIGWDGACVSTAFNVCGDPNAVCLNNAPGKRTCFTPSHGRGCKEPLCCGRICNDIDPFCCEVEWDAICVQEASIFCQNNTHEGQGSCFINHCCGAGCPNPCASCEDKSCAAAVCVYRASCCSTKWDLQCADLAYSLCVDKQSCPAPGQCNASHRNPGCNDASCCNAVCEFDPFCCRIEWDQGCADAERDICRPLTGWKCPCDGSCFTVKPSPGCNDKSCCSAVCFVQPGCCTESWDGFCTSLARDLCCGNGLCGDPCNGSCLVAHGDPNCNDPWCCEAVCAADPFCCSSSWDTLCVQFASVRCATACGQPSAGNCFAEHNGPGCRVGSCCKAVCTLDSNCCTEEWDAACVQLAKTLPACIVDKPKCGNSFAGPCCTTHDGPACSDIGCCVAVCAVDPTCCQEEWDDLCVSQSKLLAQCSACHPECGADCAGSCCEAHPTARCSNLVCCEAVCFGWTDKLGTSYSGDSYCCNVEWDSNCSSRAFEYSQILLRGGEVLEGPCFEPCPLPNCGNPISGDCCTPHGSPFCLDEKCCMAVCSFDSYCCEVSWDANCASEAFNTCPNCTLPETCGSGGSCYFPQFTPFCSDVLCCEVVCAVDPDCCNIQWDLDCVFEAFAFCTITPPAPANDECAGAFAISLGLNSFNTGGATQSLTPTPTVSCDGETQTFGADVWYVVQVTVPGIHQVSTCDLANFDTMIAIYDGNCPNLNLRACANDSPFCSQLTTTVQWNANVGVYYIRLGSPVAATGTGFMHFKRLP